MKSWTLTASASMALALATTAAVAQRDPTTPTSGAIGSHQIDRYEAIRLLQQSLASNPDATADWVTLGELAHEVALDLPSNQDQKFYRISRDAYEKALALDPNNTGLQAAVQFAREQEAGARQFDQARKAAAQTYIAARRREMAQSGINPTVQVYTAAPQPQPPARELPEQDQAPAPNPAGVPQPAPTVQPNSGYSYPVYQPFNTPQGQPYTYQQYQQSYLPPGAQNPQAPPPMTLRQLSRQLPGAILNDVTRPATSPRPR